MKNITHLKPSEVKSTIGQHVLADGYDFVLDMKKSHGTWIHDSVTGNEYLDFFTGFASMPLGFNHPSMVNDEQFKEDLYLAALTNPANADVYTAQYARFIETFGRVGIPSYLPHAFFIAGGGLAVENAVKVAMDWKVQKNFQKGHIKEKGFKVIHFEQAFHGRTGYTLSLTNTQPNKTKWFARFEDWPRIINPKIVFPFTDEGLDDLIRREQLAIMQIKQAFISNPDDVCAIILEPIQGEGGDNHFRQEFLEALRLLCDENNALLIFDEVQTGVAMTGKFWGHQHFGEKARPDLIAFGKKMQICGVLGGGKVAEVETNCFKVSSRINSTWGGNLVDMVRSTKVLEIIESDNLAENATKMGENLRAVLHNLSSTFRQITNVRGRGLFCAFDLPSGKEVQDLIAACYRNQLIILACGERSVRFRPPLNVQESEIRKMEERMYHALKSLNY
jgi:L-lysine 6-transaminase